MTEKEKTVEVTLAKRHTHRGVKYGKGAIIEVKLSDVPLLENFKVLEADSIRPAGTQKKLEEEAALKQKAEFDARVAAFDKQATKAPSLETAKAPVEAAPAVAETAGKKEKN